MVPPTPRAHARPSWLSALCSQDLVPSRPEDLGAQLGSVNPGVGLGSSWVGKKE